MTAADHEQTIREAEEMLWRADRQDQLGHGGYGGCPHDLSYFQESADVIRALLADVRREREQHAEEIAEAVGRTDKAAEAFWLARLDAANARTRRVERERDEAREKLEALSSVTVMCPNCDGAGEVQVPERSYCYQCDGQGVVESAVFLGLLNEARAENERLTRALDQACTNLAVHHGTREEGRSWGDDAELWKACLLAGWGGWQGYREEFGDVRMPIDDDGAALAAAQEPPAIECPDCGLDLEPGETHGQHPDAGCVAQEPPAECRHTNWRVEFRSPARGQVRPDPITYGQWVVCIDCGHERRGSVPPAKGGDRDE